MNALGLTLVWAGLQVSVFCLAGSLLYLAARRRNPASGAWAAGVALTLVIAVTAIALSPWPRWWSLELAATAEVEESTASQSPKEVAPARHEERLAPGMLSGPITRRQQQKTAEASEKRPASTGWQSMLVPLRNATRQVEGSRWGWPAWIAALVAIGCAFALARLIAAIAFARGYSATARPITDERLRNVLEDVRTQIGCTTDIELREIAGLGSPATMGWLHPAIILPADWRSWNDEQRRAILAHEVAHVARGDFATAIIAQVGVALHFYNPLVHWLARRLRLEQEMAADVWGAAVIGSRQRYLTTLAEMAIARSDPPTAWAMRPFLPTRGTLIRRVEMLHSQKILPTVSLSSRWRTALAVMLVAAAAVVAGLRGPAIGQTVVLAQASGAKQAAKPATTGNPINLDFVPNDAQLVLAARPSELVRIKNLDSMQKTLAAVGLFQPVDLPLEEIEEFKLVMCGLPTTEPGGNKQPWPILMVRAKKDTNWSKLVTYFIGEPQEVVVEGQAFFVQKMPRGGQLTAYWQPDDRTIVFAPRDHITETFSLRGGENGPAWAARWNEHCTGPAAMFVSRPLVGFFLNMSEGLGFQPSNPATDSEPLLFNASEVNGNVLVAGVLGCGTADDAAAMEKRVTAGVEKFKELVKATGSSGNVGEAMMIGVFGRLVEQTKIERTGATLRSVTTLDTQLANQFTQAVGPAQAAARRARSTNKMKQIAIALFNHHDMKVKFPPAVMIGPDGKTPHSWRVEILQFMELPELQAIYKEYRMDEPWDSEHNKKLIAKTDFFNEEGGQDCVYFLAGGPSTAFANPNQGPKIRDLTDGTSRTISFIEAKRDIPWTKPEDLDFDPTKPLPKVGGIFEGGFNAAMFDGSVHFLPDTLDEKTFRASVSSRGREVIDTVDNVPKVREN